MSLVLFILALWVLFEIRAAAVEFHQATLRSRHAPGTLVPILLRSEYRRRP